MLINIITKHDHVFQMLQSKPSWLSFDSNSSPDFTLISNSDHFIVLNDPNILLTLSLNKIYLIHSLCYLKGRNAEMTDTDSFYLIPQIVDLHSLQWQFIKRGMNTYIFDLKIQSIPFIFLSTAPLRSYPVVPNGIKTYVIALPERQQYVTEELMANGWEEIEIVEAKKGPPSSRLSTGQSGCLLAHLDIYQRVRLDDKHETVLVLEDDVVFRNSVHYSPLEMIMKRKNEITHIDPDWNIYFLGRCWDFCSWNGKTVSPDIVRTFHSYCSHAYMIQRKTLSMPFIYDTITIPIDEFWHQHLPQIRAYACKNPIIFQNPYQKSSIGYPIHPGLLPVCCEHVFSNIQALYILVFVFILMLFFFLSAYFF